MRPPISLEVPGTFGLDCNYWASHAGTMMWSDWQPEVIEGDFRKLAAQGIEWLRVFPLWPNFQPITLLRAQHGAPVEMRLGEAPPPPDEAGRAGVSSEMLGRFEVLCALAEKHGLKLIVGLVTGWMSGRLFTPPALAALDPLTDPTSIAWQIRMVRTLVTRLRTQRAIAAWDLGNECNCMGNAGAGTAPISGPPPSPMPSARRTRRGRWSRGCTRFAPRIAAPVPSRNGPSTIRAN